MDWLLLILGAAVTAGGVVLTLQEPRFRGRALLLTVVGIALIVISVLLAVSSGGDDEGGTTPHPTVAVTVAG